SPFVLENTKTCQESTKMYRKHEINQHHWLRQNIQKILLPHIFRKNPEQKKASYDDFAQISSITHRGREKRVRIISLFFASILLFGFFASSAFFCVHFLFGAPWSAYTRLRSPSTAALVVQVFYGLLVARPICAEIRK